MDVVSSFALLSRISLGRSRNLLLLTLAAVALLIGTSKAANAQPVLTFQGTGSDAAVSFQFASSVPLNTPGLLTTFGFVSCNAPSGESCGQVNYSAVSGVIRFVAIAGSGLDVRTFEFSSFVNNGTYSTTPGSPSSGTVTITGSTNALTLSPASLPPGTVQTAYSQTISASGGTIPYTYTVTPAGSLPPGLMLSSDGVLSGTPTTAGSFSFTVNATDTLGDSGSQAYTLGIGSTFTVTTLADDATGTASNCPGPNCSLRDALAAAAASGANENITFDPVVFPTGPGAIVQTIDLGNVLTVSSNVAILGPGANLLTVSGQGNTVFTVNSGVTASISGLTLSDGGSATLDNNGGTLTVSDSTFSGNNGEDGPIFNNGTLTVINSTFSGNTGLVSGAIDNIGALTVTNSTFAHNTSNFGGGAISNGTNSSVLIVNNSTFSENSGDGGAIISSGSLQMANTILSGDTCTGTGCPTNGANGNVVGGVTLAALGYYGGPTQTMPPLPGSTALNAGTYQTGEPGTDQRGALRPSTANATIDSGAVQITGDAPMVGQVIPNSGPTAGGTAVTIMGTGFDSATGPGNTVSAVSFGSVPATSFTVNPATGTAAASITAVSPAGAAGTVDVTVTNSIGASTKTENDGFTYFASIAISTVTLPNATWNSGYSQSLVATGGSGNYNWALAIGSLPTGLALNGSGSNWVLAGMPTATGSFSFSLTASDAATPANQATQAYTIDVLATPIVNIGLPNPELTFGQSGTITLTLAPPTGLSAQPGGTITYSIDSGTASTVGVSAGKASIPVPATLSAGSHTVVISYSGDSNYLSSGNADVTLPIGKATATITLGNLSQTYTGSPLSATATIVPAGLTVGLTYNGSATAPTAAGSYTVVATINDSNYAGTATGTLVIGKATATVTLGNLSQTYSGSPLPATATTTPTGLGVTFTYNGSATAPTAAGSYTVVATINNSNYTGTASGTLVIGKATATVTLGNLNQTYTGSPLPATATTAPTGLGVNLTYNGSAIAPTAAGSYTVVAAINNSNYTGTATGTLVIGKATATVTLGNLSQTYSGSPLPATATTTPTGLGVSFTYNGSATVPTAAGSYTVVATINNSNYTGTATGTLVIGKATATVTLGNLSQTYTGSPLSATATTVPAGLTVGITYNGSATAPTTAGSYTVVATIDNPNYTGTATGTLVIGQATLTITANNETKVYGTANPAFTGTVSAPQGSATFTESFTTGATISSPVGKYSIVPAVTGANPTDYQQTIDDGTLTITQAGTTTSISESSGASSGTSVSVSATVASTTTGTPTGTVSFYDGTALLGTATLSNGTAMYNAISLAPGVTHTLTAAYTGDMNFTASTSTGVTVIAAALDFTFTGATPAAYTAAPGAVATYSFSLSPLYGSYAGPVSFTVTGLPASATATFTPDSVAANAGPTTVRMKIQTPPAVARNGSNSLERGIVLALLLLPFSVSRSVRQKLKGRILLTVLLLAGLTAAATGCSSRNGFLLQNPQTYTLTVTAASGTLQHSQTVTLIVQ